MNIKLSEHFYYECFNYLFKLKNYMQCYIYNVFVVMNLCEAFCKDFCLFVGFLCESWR